jgi:hypothetical protein
MPESPYTGLNPFSIDDAPFFFGRDRERDLIVANLMASRLTVLYGPSGVGKSSVLNAGVLNAVRHTYQRRAPDARPQMVALAFQRWQGSPAADLTRQISETLGVAADGGVLHQLTASSTGRGGRLLLIFDQFEEYLLYHERANDDFGDLLPLVLSRPTLAVNVLISIREDSVARLDAFKGRVPNLFQNYLRLDRLTREEAHAAIVRPLDRFNQLGLAGDQPVSIEPALVDAVLDDVRAGHVTIGEEGRGRVEKNGSERRVETPYLQLVMKRLWDAERGRHSDVLRLDTYRRLGGAQRIVEGHLEETVEALSWRDRATAAAIFEHLVTPTKSKIAHTSTDLANYAHVDPEQITQLLEKLSGPDRILATVAPAADQSPETRYQIFHDVLASAVLAWTTKHRSRRQQRRRAAQIAAALAIVIILAALGYLVQRTSQQARLIDGLQRLQQDIKDVTALQGDLQDLASRNAGIEKQLAQLEQAARDAKAQEILAQLAVARRDLGAVAASNKALADQATRVGASLENNQRRIAESQGIPESAAPPPQSTVPPQSAPPPPVQVQAPTPTPSGDTPTAVAQQAPPSEATTTARGSIDPRAAAENGVRATLQRYAAAYNSLNVANVVAVFPSFNLVKELDQSFKDMRSYTLTVTPGPIQLTDDLASATVVCEVSGVFLPRVGNSARVPPSRKTFYLQRRGSDWIITRTNP